MIKKISQFIVDLIFPRHCLGCSLEKTYLCKQCLHKIKINEKGYCVHCHKPNEQGEICQQHKENCALDAVWVAANYNDKLIQDLVHYLKYNYIEDLAQVLGNLLIKYLDQNKLLEKLKINQDNTIIVPVPLFKKRLLERGYNQSQLIGQQVSQYYNIPLKNILKRIVNTPSQVNLKREQRQINVKDAFELELDSERLKDKKVILIDDVITTGSTLNEAAKVLRQKGFSQICGLVIAQRND